VSSDPAPQLFVFVPKLDSSLPDPGDAALRDGTLRQALIPLKRNVLTTSEWEELAGQLPGIGSKAQFIHPSDHCANMNNKGACGCAETDRALVKRVSRGCYLVL
jgi:hypothetical protein